MKRFRERNLAVVGLTTVVLVVALVYGALQFPKLPLVHDQATYSAYLSDAANLVPSDQISLNYAKFEMEYKPQKDDGSLGTAVKSGWDVKANKKV